jgi:flagellar hook-basal body complex protein FliE
MSSEQAVDTIVTLRPEPNGAEAPTLEATPAEPQPIAVVATTPESPITTSRQRRWLMPVAIGAAGLIASGTLGGFLFSTVHQRDAARGQLASTQTTLTATRGQLAAANAEAATRKVASDYVRLVAIDGGQVVADYGSIATCKSFGQCRTAAQQTLTDLQAFQAERAGATVPTDLANADGALRDALSAAIASVQELITGADNDDVGKIKDGLNKLHSALLAIGKAEAALDAGSS